MNFTGHLTRNHQQQHPDTAQTELLTDATSKSNTWEAAEVRTRRKLSLEQQNATEYRNMVRTEGKYG